MSYLFYILKGGRGSSKSSHIGIEIVLRRVKTKSHALVVRKYGVYLEKSVYEQCKWAINHLGMASMWQARKSPLSLTYTPTGASIIFMGADDPHRIKSIKMSDMPITDLFVEEAADFKTEDEVTTITNSIVRATLPEGLDYKIFIAYNPPKRRTHWLNKKYESAIVAEHTYIHHSTYLDNPTLSAQLLMEIDHAKENQPHRYEWEFMGKPTGSGVTPFSNLQFKKITDEEVKQFDNIRQGHDFGYAVDPASVVRLHYDKTRRGIYIFNEIYGVKLSNRVVADKLKAKGMNDIKVLCDSAEPKSIDELKSYGIQAVGVTKGKGSVEHGEKWLDDLEFIIIDPDRCPNTTREFESIDYQTDKDGNPLARLADKDNHSIDSVRYSLNDDMKSNTWGW